MLLTLEEKSQNNHMQLEIPEIVYIPEKNTLLNKAEQELRTLKTSLDTICSWKKGIGWISAHFNFFSAAINRNVKVRFIMERNMEQSYPEVLEKLKTNQFFQIKSIYSIPGACLGIYDKTKLLLDTSTTASFIESPAIWITNRDIVGMAQIYFDTIWTKSEPHN